MTNSAYVTDRTALDVERWRDLRDKGWDHMTDDERREWMGEIVPTPAASKGMYTYKDLRRVETAVEKLKTRLVGVGIDLSDIVVKTDWSYTDMITQKDMERYIRNIILLRGAITPYPTTPSAPKIGGKMDYRTANNIEKILSDIDLITTNIAKDRWYSGEIHVGEV